MQGLPHRQIATRVVPLAVIAAVAFVLIPAATQERITTFSAGTETRAGYAIEYRQTVRDRRVGRSSTPIRGRESASATTSPGTRTTSPESTDPHHVLLLQAAEGGYVLAARVRGPDPRIVLRALSDEDVSSSRRAAAGVLVATVAHGLVDVYWVRVTPVLGWLLVGMVCGLYAKSARRGDEATGDDAARSHRGRRVSRRRRARAMPRGARRLSGVTVVDNSSSPAVRAIAPAHGAAYVDPGSKPRLRCGCQSRAARDPRRGSRDDVLLAEPRRRVRSRRPRPTRRLRLHEPENESRCGLVASPHRYGRRAATG